MLKKSQASPFRGVVTWAKGVLGGGRRLRGPSISVLVGDTIGDGVAADRLKVSEALRPRIRDNTILEAG